MLRFPEPIKQLIDYFDQLPGIGPKTAEKLVFYLLKQPKVHLKGFSEAMLALHDSITICKTCQKFSETESCEICSNPQRDRSTICVIAENHDLAAIEHSGEYHGIYHVLGGTINPIDGITPEMLNIPQLMERLDETRITEIILAFNQDFEGEATTLFLQNQLEGKPFTISRLGRGLPMGSVVEYADEVTLGNALKGRTKL